MQYLIVGANGFIGSYLYRRFQEEGKNVLGTTRRNNQGTKHLLFDIQKDDAASLPWHPGENATAIVCVAESNIDRCYENYDTAYDINVRKTIVLAKELSKRNIHVICFSTDNVYDGKAGGYTEEVPANPINKYGLTKAMLEIGVQKMPNICVFRISKTIGLEHNSKNVLTEWMDRCVKGQEIPCIKGNRISFIYIEDIYQACKIAAMNQMRGIYNIVGNLGYSRAELAKIFVSKLGRNDILIREYGIDHFPFKDKRPLNVTMKNDLFCKETGYRFTDVESVVEDYIVRAGMKSDRKNLDEWDKNHVNFL